MIRLNKCTKNDETWQDQRVYNVVVTIIELFHTKYLEIAEVDKQYIFVTRQLTLTDVLTSQYILS